MQLDFDAVFYYVSNFERAIAFYRDVLGLQLRSRDDVARFDIGGVLFEVVPTFGHTKLQDVPPSQKQSGWSAGNARLCFKVDDMSATVAELRAKGVPVGDPEPKSNGTLASFYDPDGNELCLWEYA